MEQSEADAMVRAALDHGVNFFDTADAYMAGQSETMLGQAFRNLGLSRSDLFVSSKVNNPMGPGPNDRGLSRKHIMESIDASLRRLRTDYVDLYQAHRWDVETPIEETMVAFADVVRAGKAHYIGVSEWTADQIREGAALAAQLGVPFVSSQPQYSMLWRVIEAEVVPACVDEGLSQIVWSPLAQGVLTGKYLPGSPPPDGSRATDEAGGGGNFVKRWLREPVLEAVQRLKPIAAEAGLTMAQFGIAWVLSNDNVASAIIGASRPEQIEENLGAVGKRLDADTLAAVDAALGDLVSRDPALTESPNPRA